MQYLLKLYYPFITWLFFISFNFAQFTGGTGNGFTSFSLFSTQCFCFHGNSGSGYSHDSVFYTWQTCSHFHGSTASGYTFSSGIFNQCPLYFGNEGSGYTYDLTFCAPLAHVELLLTGHSISPTRKKLDWYLTSNLQIDHFKIQKSSDGTQWITITILPGDQWSWIDEHPDTLSLIWYRIQAIGEISLFSNAIRFANNPDFSPQITVYPNPVPSSSLVHILVSSSLPFSYEVFDINGKLITSGKGEASVSFPSPPSAGIYFLTITFSNGHQVHFKLIVT